MLSPRRTYRLLLRLHTDQGARASVAHLTAHENRCCKWNWRQYYSICQTSCFSYMFHAWIDDISCPVNRKGHIMAKDWLRGTCYCSKSYLFSLYYCLHIVHLCINMLKQVVKCNRSPMIFSSWFPFFPLHVSSWMQCYSHKYCAQCSHWTYNSKGHYDPLSEFSEGQFAISEGHEKTITVAKTCYMGEPVIMCVEGWVGGVCMRIWDARRKTFYWINSKCSFQGGYWTTQNETMSIKWYKSFKICEIYVQFSTIVHLNRSFHSLISKRCHSFSTRTYMLHIMVTILYYTFRQFRFPSILLPDFFYYIRFKSTVHSSITSIPVSHQVCMRKRERQTDRDRERQTKRQRQRDQGKLFLKYAQWQKEQTKNVNFLHVPLLMIITSQKMHCHTTQSTATPSGNNAMKFSAEVSGAHVAARVKGPEAANIDNKACIEAFQQLLWARHGLRR